MKELKRLSIIWGLLLFAIFSVLTFFALKWKSKTAGYFDLEEKLKSSTQSNYESKHTYPEKGQEVIVTFKELKEDNILEELKYNDDECDGYVLVTKNDVVEFKPFIKCNNYTTKDYDKHNKNE